MDTAGHCKGKWVAHMLGWGGKRGVVGMLKGMQAAGSPAAAGTAPAGSRAAAGTGAGSRDRRAPAASERVRKLACTDKPAVAAPDTRLGTGKYIPSVACTAEVPRDTVRAGRTVARRRIRSIAADKT